LKLFARKSDEPIAQGGTEAEQIKVAGSGVAENPSVGAAAEETIARFKNGNPRKSSRGTSGRADPASAALADQQAKIQAELGKLYSPENWKAIVKAPADLRLALTGREHWNLSKDEVETLATTASTAAQYWLVADPKYLALTLFIFNISVIYGSRVALDVAASRAEKQAARKGQSESS